MYLERVLPLHTWKVCERRRVRTSGLVSLGAAPHKLRRWGQAATHQDLRKALLVLQQAVDGARRQLGEGGVCGRQEGSAWLVSTGRKRAA